MHDTSGILLGQPQPADPVFIKNEQGRVLAFPSVATVLISDTILQNIVAMTRIAVRQDTIELLAAAGVLTPEQAAKLQYEPQAATEAAPFGADLPKHDAQSPDASPST